MTDVIRYEQIECFMHESTKLKFLKISVIIFVVYYWDFRKLKHGRQNFQSCFSNLVRDQARGENEG